MARGLTARIALAFFGVAIVTWLAIGGALFLLLRQLRVDQAGGRLEDVATLLASQARQSILAGDVQAGLASIRDQATDLGTTVYVVGSGGRIFGAEGSASPPAGTFQVDLGSATSHGVTTFPNGQPYVYAATSLRGGALIGQRAFVAATAAVPSTPVAALPLEGPTEVREVIARFNAMTAELAETRHRENELLANLRHDLRTPLTVIGGFAAALADGTATGEAAGRAARAIGEESARLEALVDELDAIERLRTGAAGLRPEPIDAIDALRRTAERFAQGADSAGVEIVVEAAPTEPGRIETAPTEPTNDLRFAADRLAVDRMLGNLVANALQAVPRPGGHVWLRSEE